MRSLDRLVVLLDEGLIDEIVQPLMSGKEADVFIVRAKEDYRVAKVYKDAQHRSFRQRAAYTEGRRVRNSRQQRAMERGSKYGKEQSEVAWQNAEVDALYLLGSAGVAVPKPHLFYDGILLMDLVLDPTGKPAPRLVDCDFTPEEAWYVHGFVVSEVVKMLCAGLIHGDLSEYNVLIAWNGPAIIDFPQAVSAAHNRSARELLVRDVTNISRYLSRFDNMIGESRFGEEMWEKFERAQLFPDTPLTGRWRAPTRRADPRAVLREVEAAAREARPRTRR